MTRNKDKFIFLTTMNSAKVSFGDNAKGNIVGKDKVDKLPNYFIDDVLLVERLSPLWDKGNKVIFNTTQHHDINQADK